MVSFLLFIDSLDAAPNSPKKVKRLEDGTFKNEKNGEIFHESKKEIRLSFKASDGKETITCVCFTKIASMILPVDTDEFTAMDEVDQRATVKELLYETKLLTLRSQGETFLLLDVEKVEGDEESTKKSTKKE